MKRLLPILFLCLVLASCYKYIKVDNSIKYTVYGIHDLTIDQNDSGVLDLGIELLSGDPTNEYINFTVSGVPANVDLNLDSIVFRPNYSFPLVFHAHSPKPGVYPITITMTSPTVGTKVYKLQLTVTSLTDCTQQFSKSQIYSIDNRHEVQMSIGSATNPYAYIKRIGCDTLQVHVMIDSMEPGSEPDGVQIMIAQFNTFVNCSANTLTVYPQAAGWLQPANESVRGRGTFVPVTANTATITINDTVYSGTQINSTCTFTIY